MRLEKSAAAVRRQGKAGEVFQRFCRNRLAVVGAAIMALLILVAVAAPLLAPYAYDAQDASAAKEGPSLSHPFGTDNYGRDILSRCIYGARISLSVGILAVGAAILVGGLLGAVLWGSYDHVQGDPQIMVILGCQVKPWGPSVLLQDRLDKALSYLEDHPDLTVVVSGGQGPDEHISEAQCMYDYLTAHGVDGEQILLEDQSHNTVQNLRYTVDLLAKAGYDTTADMVVVSNGFHLTRVRMLWNRVCGGDDNLSTLAAPSSHLPSRLKMYLREPLALVKSFLFDR